MVAPPTYELAHGLGRDTNPPGQSRCTYVFSHITLSSCNCDSYCLVFAFITFVTIKKLDKIGMEMPVQAQTL